MATEADEPTDPPISNAQWAAVRSALQEIGRALEPLSDEMKARVLASACIITDCGDRVVDILGGNA